MGISEVARPTFEGDEAGRCGGCGSRAIERFSVCQDRDLGVCTGCSRVQEVETRDWPESAMCGNCAFRVGSPERADPYRWAEVADLVETGVPFHCHKGLSYDLMSGRFAAPSPASGRVTVCAGWFAAFAAKFRRAERAREELSGDGFELAKGG